MPEKKTTAKKVAKKATAKKTPATSTPEQAVAKKVTAKKTGTKKVRTKKTSGKKAAAPAGGFSLDDALAIASTRGDDESKLHADNVAKEKARKALEEAEAKKQKQSFGAASLEDILGLNPNAATQTKIRDENKVPAKLKKFYDLLINLRNHVKHGLATHAEETLKRSSKEESGDLSGYSQHMGDAGTDSFDRDFALSMVSSEQDALQEIEAAIDRIFKGTYGLCEITGKQIRDERLMAVPFTRYSKKTQEQIEKNTFRVRNQAGGVFADASSEDSLNYGSDEDDS